MRFRPLEYRKRRPNLDQAVEKPADREAIMDPIKREATDAQCRYPAARNNLYVSVDARVAADHSIRKLRELVDGVLRETDGGLIERFRVRWRDCVQCRIATLRTCCLHDAARSAIYDRRNDACREPLEIRMNYVDGFVLAVPVANLGEYKKMARKAGKIWMEHGALVNRVRLASVGFQ